MDIATIRTSTSEELERQLAEARAQLEDLRFRASARELKNVHEIRNTRRTIARILSVLRERELGIPAASQLVGSRGAGENQESRVPVMPA